jgi:hypothetical protein
MTAHKSLVWKLVLPVPVVIGILILGAVLFIPRWVERNAVERSIAAASQTTNIFRTLRAYYTENVVSRLVPSGRAKAIADYRNEDGAIPLPATFIHDMSCSRKTTRASGSIAPIPSPIAKTASSMPSRRRHGAF